jgi:hypothetical protein
LAPVTWTSTTPFQAIGVTIEHVHRQRLVGQDVDNALDAKGARAGRPGRLVGRLGALPGRAADDDRLDGASGRRRRGARRIDDIAARRLGGDDALGLARIDHLAVARPERGMAEAGKAGHRRVHRRLGQDGSGHERHGQGAGDGEGGFHQRWSLSIKSLSRAVSLGSRARTV